MKTTDESLDADIEAEDAACEDEDNGAVDNNEKITIRMFFSYFLATTWKFFAGYFAFVLIFAIVFKTVLSLSIVPSESMEPTIMTGDFLISSRKEIKLEDIHRYDIITFTPPIDDEIIYVKRVIGLPGETIEVKDGKVYADGVELDNSFTNGPQNRNGDGTWTVPADCFFMMGDNRNNSADSRYWGNTPFVHISAVEAKAKLVVFPFSHFGGFPSL